VIFSTCYYLVAALVLNTIRIYMNEENIEKKGSSELLSSSSSTRNTSPPSLFPPLTRGGAELSLYLFLANIFQLIGLQSTSAIVASFIVQLTTVFVPLIEGLRGGERGGTRGCRSDK